MKQTTFLLCLIYCSLSIHAQKIDIPKDSVKTLLCRKWEAAYTLMGTMRIDMSPSAPVMMFEFKKDNSFTISNDKAGGNTKGIWAFDQTNENSHPERQWRIKFEYHRAKGK